jgi:hypothetical protein
VVQSPRVGFVLIGMINCLERQAPSNCIQNFPAQVVLGEAPEFDLGAYDPLRLTGSAELSPGTGVNAIR